MILRDIEGELYGRSNFTPIELDVMEALLHLTQTFHNIVTEAGRASLTEQEYARCKLCLQYWIDTKAEFSDDEEDENLSQAKTIARAFV